MAQKNSQTHKFEIKNFKDVYDYCYLNGVMDINSFVEKCFKQGFDIEKYGLLSDENTIKTGGEREKQVEIEVIREKRVEIPVEVIKYVDREIIKEVPVEKIIEVIKEVPVEKIVNIYDNDDEKIFQLNKDFEEERRKFSTKIEEMENIFQKEMSKKDVDLDELRQTLDKLRHSEPEKNNDKKLLMIQETLTKLRKEIIDKDKLIKELEEKIKNLESIKINQGAVFLKGSNLTENL